MAKLYWRVKIDGKWAWRAADDDNTIIVAPTVHAIIMTQMKQGDLYGYPASHEEE